MNVWRYKEQISTKTLQLSSKNRAGRPLGHSRENRLSGETVKSVTSSPFLSTELHFGYMYCFHWHKKQQMLGLCKGTRDDATILTSAKSALQWCCNQSFSFSRSLTSRPSRYSPLPFCPLRWRPTLHFLSAIVNICSASWLLSPSWQWYGWDVMPKCSQMWVMVFHEMRSWRSGSCRSPDQLQLCNWIQS